MCHRLGTGRADDAFFTNNLGRRRSFFGVWIVAGGRSTTGALALAWPSSTSDPSVASSKSLTSGPSSSQQVSGSSPLASCSAPSLSAHSLSIARPSDSTAASSSTFAPRSTARRCVSLADGTRCHEPMPRFRNNERLLAPTMRCPWVVKIKLCGLMVWRSDLFPTMVKTLSFGRVRRR